MEEIKRKRGRPPKKGGRTCQVNVLFTPEELGDIRDGMTFSGESQSEIIRKGTALYLSQMKNQHVDDEYYEYYDDYDYENDDF